MKNVLAAILSLHLLAMTGCASSSTAGAAPDAHTSASSLDWAGRYVGIVPCADCAGIDTEIVLASDLSYVLRTRYLGKDARPFERRGTFVWDDRGGSIRLEGMSDGPDRYQVGENRLVQLDLAGNRIEGSLAQRYVLTKVGTGTRVDALAGTWRLMALASGPIDAERVPTLSFDVDLNRVVGFAGCNRLTGGFAASADGVIRLGPLATTRMACPEPNVEPAFLVALDATASFRVSGATLELLDADGTVQARFVRSETPSG